MVAKTHHRSAFTLIELLVVIAILSLLVAILMPSLQRAKEITHRVICASNMQHLVVTGWQFANENNGRGPGSGETKEGWSKSWQNVLNEVYHMKPQVPRLAATYNPKMLSCPSLRPGNSARRPFAWNLDAMGGRTWGGNPSPQGPYGLLHPDPGAVTNGWKYYVLGARLRDFKEPAFQFLIIERERTNDGFYEGMDASLWDGHVYLGTSPSYASPGGWWSFRHVNLTGNFVFFDGHIEALSPDDELATKRRTLLRP